MINNQRMSGESVIVYGNFTLDLKKYPRRGTKQEKTDIIIINFLMHEEFLTKCAKSLDDAIKYYNACKDYSYLFVSPESPEFSRVNKRYTAKEIIQLHSMITNRPIRGAGEYLERMRGFAVADQVYISYLSCRDFYMNLFGAIKGAKDAHFERRDYHYRVVPPMEIYGHLGNPIMGQIYNAYELMELFTYTHYLKKHHILKELPIPSFIPKLQEMAQAHMMRNLYPAAAAKKKIGMAAAPAVTSFYDDLCEDDACNNLYEDNPCEEKLCEEVDDDLRSICSTRPSCHKWQMDFEVRRAKIDGLPPAVDMSLLLAGDQRSPKRVETQEEIPDGRSAPQEKENPIMITLGEKLRMIKEKRRLEGEMHGSGSSGPIQCGIGSGRSCGFSQPSPNQAYLKNSVSQAVAWDSKRSHISN